MSRITKLLETLNMKRIDTVAFEDEYKDYIMTAKIKAELNDALKEFNKNSGIKALELKNDSDYDKIERLTYLTRYYYEPIKSISLEIEEDWRKDYKETGNQLPVLLKFNSVKRKISPKDSNDDIEYRMYYKEKTEIEGDKLYLFNNKLRVNYIMPSKTGLEVSCAISLY